LRSTVCEMARGMSGKNVDFFFKGLIEGTVTAEFLSSRPAIERRPG
jgi:hypothetical protein